MWRRLALAVIALFSMATACHGYAVESPWTLGHFQHTSWTTKDGAPSDIAALAQTSDGYLWIGSTRGLYRFDGIRFVHFEPVAGETLPSSQVYSLFAPASGGLWISYEGSGVSFLKNGHLTNYGAKEGFRGTSNLFGDGNGSIWANVDGGIKRYKDGAWTTIQVSPDEGLKRATLFVDREGIVWASLRQELYRLRTDHARFEDTGIKTEVAEAIAETADGSLLISQIGGPVLRFSRHGDALTKVDTTYAVDSVGIVPDLRGGLWFASLGHGIYRFTDQNTALTGNAALPANSEHYGKSDGLSGDYVWPALKDREGNIWFGTQAGLDRFSESNFSTVVMPEGIHDVALATGPDGNMWAGSSNQPLLLLTPMAYRETSLRSPVLALQQNSRNGAVVVGGRDGRLWSVDAQGDATFMPILSKTSNHGWEASIVRARDNQLWVLVSGSPADVVIQSGRTWNTFAQLDQLRSLFADARGCVWAGSANVNQLHSFCNGTAKTYSALDGLGIGSTIAFAERSGELWVGGSDGIAVKKAARFNPITLADGYPLKDVTAILASHDGAMWVHDIDGILRLDSEGTSPMGTAQLSRITYRSFNEADKDLGAASQLLPTPSAAVASDGRLWFATESGVVWLDPNDLIKTPPPPPVLIEAINADGTSIPMAAAEVLHPGTRSLDISYTATSLTQSNKIRFRYRLSGVDREWHQANHGRIASYTNLGPGRYHFQVIAANSAGVWNEQGANLDITILPGPLQSWWFHTLCVVAAIMILVIFVSWRTRAAANKVRLHMEVRDRERMRIAEDIHDTLLQSLQGLMFHLQRTIRSLPEDSPSRHLLDRSAQLARSAMVEGRDRILALQKTTSDRDFFSAINRIGTDLAAIHEMAYRAELIGRQRQLRQAVFDEVLDIVREALLNAFLHSGGTCVELTVNFSRYRLSIQVSDNGRGIEDSVLIDGGRAGHWGLATMRDRAKRISSSVTWRGRTPCGTTLDLMVPARIVYRGWFQRLRILKSDIPDNPLRDP